MKTVLLKSLIKEYEKEIARLSEAKITLSVDSFIALSEKLYREIKAKGISGEADEENDMLLFQYGTYDWGDELGKHFSFNMTRQFTEVNDDMYQLSLTLIFDPIEFRNLKSYNSWSSAFEQVAEWVEHIKATDGYKMANLHPFKSYRLGFDRV